MPAWIDIVGRAIPVTLRGRFLRLANLRRERRRLREVPERRTCSRRSRRRGATASASCTRRRAWRFYIALALVREPAASTARHRSPLRTYLARVRRSCAVTQSPRFLLARLRDRA